MCGEPLLQRLLPALSGPLEQQSACSASRGVCFCHRGMSVMEEMMLFPCKSLSKSTLILLFIFRSCGVLQPLCDRAGRHRPVPLTP